MWPEGRRTGRERGRRAEDFEGGTHLGAGQVCGGRFGKNLWLPPGLARCGGHRGAVEGLSPQTEG